MRLRFSGTALMIILGYYFIINLILFIAMYVDKKRAIKNTWRIPEKTLFLLAALGGGLGGFIGMFTQRHKTKHPSFYIVFGITTILHLIFGYFLFKTFALNIKF